MGETGNYIGRSWGADENRTGLIASGCIIALPCGSIYEGNILRGKETSRSGIAFGFRPGADPMVAIGGIQYSRIVCR
jgi:hypothetical protein